MLKQACLTGMVLTMLLNPMSAYAASPSYTAALTLPNSWLPVGGKSDATLTLTNDGDVLAKAGLMIRMPSGFSAANLPSACGGGFRVAPRTGSLVLAGVSIPAKGSCTFRFTMNVPPVASMPPSERRIFSIVPAKSPNLATADAISVPVISEILGSTPGLYSNTTFPAGISSVAQLDLFITPKTDPGPNSNVFWSNQIDSLGGYTGLQSTELASGPEGYGKQFLFSLWGATDARPGTPATAGIGAGSYCTVSQTATDGASGAQCRYRYEWQAGHIYRFRVTADTALGAGWYKSNVTDISPGSNHDSFDIGSIYVGNQKTDVPVTTISQWVEYFDWNSARTSCESVAHTEVKFKIQAFDQFGTRVIVPAPHVSANAGCSESFFTVGSGKNGEATLVGGPNQSAAGLLKTDGKCLSTKAGLTDGSPVGSNDAILQTCPTLDDMRRVGGGSYSSHLWVQSAAGTIQIKNNYCLTAQGEDVGDKVILATCVQNAANQKWTFTQPDKAPLGTQIVATSRNLCLAQGAPDGTLNLQSCALVGNIWTIPGKSFSY